MNGSIEKRILMGAWELELLAAELSQGDGSE